MSILLKETGIIPLLKLITSFEKIMGKKKVKELLKTSPQTLLELLDTNLIYLNEDEASGKLKKETPWSKEKFEEYFNKLNFTRYQTIILKMLLKRNSPVTLKELEKEFKENGIKVNTGSMIGGSLAGITKKCKAYAIPTLILSKKTNVGEYKYSVTLNKILIPKLKEHLKQYS